MIAKLIDALDKQVGTVVVADLARAKGTAYEPRQVRVGKTVFREPAGDVLDVQDPDEWREVVN